MSEPQNRYVVTFDSGHAVSVDAPDALSAAKTAKAGYDGGQHRVLRVLLGAKAQGGVSA